MAAFEQVLRFWFEEVPPTNWWQKDPQFDQLVRTRFGALHEQALQAELFSWRTQPEGRLAEIIVLDQFSRNMFRHDARAFAADGMALILAQEAVVAGADQELTTLEKSFLYMPFMHSESALIHAQAVKLFSQPGLESNLEFEYRHKAIIDRFGRYPHRNDLLGRASTAQEIEFLQQPGSHF